MQDEMDLIFARWQAEPDEPEPPTIKCDSCAQLLTPESTCGTWKYNDGSGRLVGLHETTCTACRDIRHREREQERMAAEQEERYEKFVAEIPQRYRAAHVDQTEPGLRAQLRRWYGQREISTCMLHGKTKGTGKTHAAYAIAKALVKAGIGVIFESWPDLMAELRTESMQTTEPEIAKYMSNYKGLVVIDDLGAGKVSDFAVQELYRIVANRDAECLHLLVTSNNTIAELSAMLDDRISSRLAGGLVIHVTGDDRRIKRVEAFIETAKVTAPEPKRGGSSE